MSDEKEMTWAPCPRCGEPMGWPVGEPENGRTNLTAGEHDQ